MTKLIPYPLAEPVSSKEGWEAAIKEKRQTDQRGRGKKGPLSATFLIPVLWLCHCGSSAQEAHPLPAASQFLLRRQIHTDKPGQRGTEDPGLRQGRVWARKRHHPGCYRNSSQGSRHPSIFLMKKETVGMLGDLVLSCQKPQIQTKAQLLETVSTPTRPTQLRSQN